MREYSPVLVGMLFRRYPLEYFPSRARWGRQSGWRWCLRETLPVMIGSFQGAAYTRARSLVLICIRETVINRTTDSNFESKHYPLLLVWP